MLGLRPLTEERILRDRYYKLIEHLSSNYDGRVSYLEFDYNNEISANKKSFMV